jgi:nucleoside triphosphate pyrophosphatase
MGVKFSVEPSNFEEYLDDSKLPENIAKELARGKALTVARSHPNAVVIGADIVLSVNGHQIGNARYEAEARAMLEETLRNPNYIVTAVCIICIKDNIDTVNISRNIVYPKPIDHSAVENYLKSGNYKGKAGGYGVQDPLAVSLIDRIEGDYESVVGLPTALLAQMLNSLGIKSHPANFPIPKGLIVKSNA